MWYNIFHPYLCKIDNKKTKNWSRMCIDTKKTHRKKYIMNGFTQNGPQ